LTFEHLCEPFVFTGDNKHGTTDDNAVREAVRRMMLRGLSVERDLHADPKPIRPIDVMKPERFVLRELTRKLGPSQKKG
jgi:hypothetical protein